MARLLKYILILVVVVSATTGLFAKPRTVYLDKELKEAVYAYYVEIVSYTDSTIKFKPVDGYEGVYSVDWMMDTGKIFKPFNPDNIFTARLHGPILHDQKIAKNSTGCWPPQGEKVLIVIGKGGYVSLFADKQDNYYRFWSPAFTGSDALFCFKIPAAKIAGGTGLKDSLAGYGTCWGGCLLPADKLTTYGHLTERWTYTGMAQMNNGNALFIWDKANSAPFFLDGINAWDIKYLNKRLKVEGILVQFVNGKSMIKDWKIVDVE